jgi:putative membrane-bound dehydrogenase-like protein
VFSGFGLSNVQGLLNSFNWSMDNRIHGATSGSGAQVTATAQPFEPPLVLRGRDFSFDPRTRQIRPESGGAQHGLTFDDWGHKFVCHNSDHLIQVMYEDRYAARNPFYAAPRPRLSIASDGPQADVYRISPVEPWRIVRTRLRVQGLVPGPVEGGGTPAGYFTSATGVTVYRGNAWPAAYRGNVFVGDVGGNLVHRKTLTSEGVAFRGDRAEEGKEFLASTDIWFRPVQFCNGPDGCLYVADMYREVIEHPDSLPPIIKKHLDLNSGFDRGRIYRIAPKGFQTKAEPNLDKLGSDALVALLDYSNAWHVETAQRLLWERRDTEAVPSLRLLARDTGATAGRVRAMYLLRDLGALDEKTIFGALDADDAGVRRHAVRLAESFADPSDALLARLGRLAGDADPEVRYQVAFTLGTWEQHDWVEALAAIAGLDGTNRWFRAAILSSSRSVAGQLAAVLLHDETYRESDSAEDLLRQLAHVAGTAGDSDGATACVHALESLPESSNGLRDLVLTELVTGARASAHASDVRDALQASPFARDALDRIVTRALEQVQDDSVPASEREEAAKSLALADEKLAEPVLFGLVNGDVPDNVKKLVLTMLSRFRDPAVGDQLVSMLANASDAFRSPLLDAVFSRADWVNALLAAIERGQVDYAALPSTYRHRLRTHSDTTIRGRAARIDAAHAPDFVRDQLEEFEAVAELDGDPAMGLAIFLERCATCHRLGGYGQAVGPDLTGVRDWDTARIVTSIAQPNAEINPQYIAYEVETTDGRYYAGILDAETATSITLRMSGSAPTILKSQIASVSPMNISLMPEDLAVDLDAQRVADLVAFVRQE